MTSKTHHARNIFGTPNTPVLSVFMWYKTFCSRKHLQYLSHERITEKVLSAVATLYITCICIFTQACLGSDTKSVCAIKMAVFLLFALMTIAELASGRQFHVQNRHGHKIWVGILGNPGKGQPENGGFVLNSGQRRTVNVADDWAGRFWARTGCNFNGNGHGHCATGDCGDKLRCNGAGGVPPVTLAEVTLRGAGGQDFYDVSLVDGFNVPVQMRPTQGRAAGRYKCTTAACSRNLNPGCPDNLKVRDGGNVVGCKSSCLASSTDQYCCRGRYNNPNVCRSSPSAVYFKSNCPGAYSYAYDDGTSTFTCQNTDYEIIFG